MSTPTNSGDPAVKSTDAINVTIAQLQQERFYGSLELKFEDGEIVLLKKTETFKTIRRNNRGEGNDRT